MHKYLLYFLGFILFAGCHNAHLSKLNAFFETPLPYKYLALPISAEKYQDTINITIYDTFPNFSQAYSYLRASYLVYNIKALLQPAQPLKIVHEITNGSQDLSETTDSLYVIRYSQKDISEIINLYEYNFNFVFCVNYLVKNVSPAVFEDICYSQKFNQTFLEGYTGNETFTNLLIDYTFNCSNPDFENSLTYKKIRMLSLVTQNDISGPRSKFFQVCFNLCNMPQIKRDEPPPFQPTAEYAEFLQKEYDASHK